MLIQCNNQKRSGRMKSWLAYHWKTRQQETLKTTQESINEEDRPREVSMPVAWRPLRVTLGEICMFISA